MRPGELTHGIVYCKCIFTYQFCAKLCMYILVRFISGKSKVSRLWAKMQKIKQFVIDFNLHHNSLYSARQASTCDHSLDCCVCSLMMMKASCPEPLFPISVEFCSCDHLKPGGGRWRGHGDINQIPKTFHWFFVKHPFLPLIQRTTNRFHCLRHSAVKKTLVDGWQGVRELGDSRST